MGKRRDPNAKRDTVREAEVLASEVRSDGKGEDPAVAALLSDEFATMKDADALEIGLALQQIVRGQASILENLQTQGEALIRLRERMDAYDQSAARWNEDREAFLKDIDARAEKLRWADSKRDEMTARAGLQTTRIMEGARAAAATDRLKFAEALKTMPTEKVRHPGIPVLYQKDGLTSYRIEPLVIRIKGRQWVLPPDKEVEVPRVVALRLREIERSQAETDERHDALVVDGGFKQKNNDRVLAGRWSEINSKYGSPTDAMQIVTPDEAEE